MSFSTSPTRNIKKGDTPDLNDGQQSIRMAAQNISRGTACVVILGFVTIATVANSIDNSRFVPVQNKDNSGGSPGDLETRGVTAPQLVALETLDDLDVGDFVEISVTNGIVQKATSGAKYARYLGREAALLDINAFTPFDHKLTEGVVPDEPLLAGEEGWFKLIEVSNNG